jgi:hypothetical protein
MVVSFLILAAQIFNSSWVITEKEVYLILQFKQQTK